MASKQTVSFKLNGNDVDAVVEPRELLIHTLRERLAHTGPHIGCETSHCGACTVDINGESVKSCTCLTVQCQDADIVTIEGLERDGALHALQEGFTEKHGLQCGFCTPGMIMKAWALLQRNPNPTDIQIIATLDNNLCRCGAHKRIIDAVHDAAKEMGGF